MYNKPRAYKVGQVVTLPAIKSEGVMFPTKATVTRIPDKQGIMHVQQEGEDGSFPVAISLATGKIRAAIVFDMPC